MRLCTRSLLIASALFFASASAALAQYDGTASGALLIRMSPANPAPGSTVTLTLVSPVYDLEHSTIVWRAGKKTLAEGSGATAITVTAGKAGEATSVTAIIANSAGGDSASITIIPTRVDLLWESDSYTPPLYRGVAMPSAGSHVRMLAIPYLPKPGGGFYDAKDLRYTWHLNDGTLANLSGKGKQSISIGAPDLFNSYTIQVDVSNVSGTINGSAQVTLSSVEPQLLLYADHPLYGMQYHRSLGKNATVEVGEATLAAVPYFAPVTSADSPLLNYAWRVNDNSITPDSVHPSEVTLQSTGIGTVAALALELTHTRQILMQSTGAWTVTFTAQGGGKMTDPFHR